MEDKMDVQTGMAKAHGRTALLRVLEEWELQMTGNGPPTSFALLADRADELLDAIAEFIDARAQSRAGMKPTHKGNYGVPPDVDAYYGRTTDPLRIHEPGGAE